MIRYDRETNRISLDTAHSSLQFAVREGLLLQTYSGPRLRGWAAEERAPHNDPGCWPNLLPQVCAVPGAGDQRTCALQAEFSDGSEAGELYFKSAGVSAGKYALEGLPAFHGGEAEAETLRLVLEDPMGLQVELLFGVFEDCDLITRAMRVTNTGAQPVRLRKAASLCMDLPKGPLELVTFDGDWAAERRMHRTPLRPGVQSVGSTGGIPTHAHNPAVILCRPDTGEEQGECWGAAFVYSGNFLIEAESSIAGSRLVMGIHPYHFCWTLEPGECFTAPEAALVYSDRGFGEMSHRFHKAIRSHLLRGPWADMERPRPVLINSWEAAYFDFDEAKLLRLAQAAKQAGIDLFVLDDGWFEGRNADTTSLGDWTVDYSKLPGGIPGLCEKIRALGMDFGIWVEPEAISPESRLYREHPDWALQIPGRKNLEIRHQYTLDFSRPEVVDGIWEQLRALLDSCPVKYVKWDMNRSLTHVWSAGLPAARQGEVYHRYVLGVYSLQQRLLERYPDLLLENCAGGGARFDCGMLYYSPQIWCSDNTDALDRLFIQYGTSFFYPASTVGAHFSTVPNHCTGRISSPEARMASALSGTFGYELDLTRYSAEELEQLRGYSELYRKCGRMIRTARLYRLVPPTGRGAAWMYLAEDKNEAMVFAVGDALTGGRLPLPGLNPERSYRSEEGESWTGEELSRLGLPLPRCWGDVPAVIWHLTAIDN